MSAEPQKQSLRQIYRDNLYRRQRLTFSIVTIAMAVLVVLSLLVISGVIRLPLGSEFSKKEALAQPGGIPCPEEGSVPLDPSTISVQVLNASSESGLAGTVSDALTSVGFDVIDPDNAPTEGAKIAEINAGPLAIQQAYTVARYFPDSDIILTDSSSEKVTVILGSFYEQVLSADDAQTIVKDTKPFVGHSKCLPVDPKLVEKAQMKATRGESGSESETPSEEQKNEDEDSPS